MLTPPGRGALAVVGVAGAGAIGAIDGLFTPHGGSPVALRPDGAICVGRWQSLVAAAGEELVVVRHAADRLEIHCHGGLAAPTAVLESLVARGATRLSWSEWLERTAPSGAIAAEARAALCRAGGPKAARILSRQLAGALDRDLEQIRSLVAAGAAAAAGDAIDRLLRAARVGLRLTRPWRVVLAGAVNAGKSSLVNALAGHARSIVSDVPGTTRDLVETRIVLDGWEVDLVDAAGGRDDDRDAGAVERAGIARAQAARATADLVLRVTAADAAGPPVGLRPGELLVISKADRAAVGAAAWPDAVWTCAVTGEGIDRLAARIVAALVPEELAEPGLFAGGMPFTARQVRELEALRGR